MPFILPSFEAYRMARVMERSCRTSLRPAESSPKSMAGGASVMFEERSKTI